MQPLIPVRVLITVISVEELVTLEKQPVQITTRKRLIQLVALFVIAGLAAGGAWSLWLSPLKVQTASTEHHVPIQVFASAPARAK